MPSKRAANPMRTARGDRFHRRDEISGFCDLDPVEDDHVAKPGKAANIEGFLLPGLVLPSFVGHIDFEQLVKVLLHGRGAAKTRRRRRSTAVWIRLPRIGHRQIPLTVTMTI